MPEAVDLYQRALDFDELDEALYCRLMRLHGLLGRRELVAKTFQRYQTAFKSRLDLEPSAESL
ncbi:MAG: bacterial transcriptional activator domain-containing protein [Proteobacteria bacterium]|nr:bacterial transcriptional activator domain-containing protein [Pseudomonadota bacterium]MBU1715106.1 bacterial transcriptional activator domain-containing protein [Pseudomonadota bacterium]